MNKAKLFIIGGIVVVIIIIFVIVSFFNVKSPFTPTPTVPLPSVNPSVTQPVFDTSEQYITSITPLDTNVSYLPVQPVQINFTQPVSITTLRYTISPSTESFVTVGENPNHAIIAPKTFWPNGIITITISGTTLSSSGKALKNPQSYKLNIAIPTIPDIEGDY